jgi:4-amino-4-deoxy-L-arabinose transferase-like glycosyltransferase
VSGIRPLWLLLILLVAGVLGWLGALLTAGAGLVAPVLVRSSVITLAAVALLVLGLGIRVQRDKKRPPAARMNPLVATRTLALAQAGAYAGVLIAGWHGGVLVHLTAATGFGTATVNDALLMVVGGLVLVIVGYIVEQFCRLPPEDGADGTSNGTGQNGGETRPRSGPAYGMKGDGGYAHTEGP